MRQVLGAIAEFEKTTLVAKLAAARKRKRLANGRCEGRKSLVELRPDVVALARPRGLWGRRDRDDLAKKMTPEQIAEAQKMAREWKPK